MRWAIALVAPLALGACNQIFGLKPTKEFDAAVDVIPEAPLPRVQLTLQIAAVDASGQPAGVTFAPITPAPKVRIATATGAFMDATYGADGSIEIPQSFPGTQWRLEYTLGADPPVEVQWSPGDGLGHLIVPLSGRADRDPPPMTGRYEITPTGHGVPYSLPRVFTAGLWTEVATPTIAGQTVSTNYANAVSLSGPRGNPLAARGDRGLLVDFAVANNCRQSLGSADFSPDLSASPSIVTPPWAVTKRTPIATIGIATVGRMLSGLGNLEGMLGVTGSISYGYTPSLSLPGFSQAIAGEVLPGPTLLTFLRCNYDVSPLPAANAPAYLEVKGFPRIIHAQLVDRRDVGGLSLSSGMEVDATTASDAFDLGFPAAIPNSFKLATPDAQMKDLSGTTDVTITAMPGAYTLSFTPETGFQIDYTEVRLHEIDGATLTLLRTFTFIGTSVQIDGSNFTAGKKYVFEVRAHRGAPMAAQGDFTQLQYPLGLAVVFTRTIQT